MFIVFFKIICFIPKRRGVLVMLVMFMKRDFTFPQRLPYIIKSELSASKSHVRKSVLIAISTSVEPLVPTPRGHALSLVDTFKKLNYVNKMNLCIVYSITAKAYISLCS